MIIGIILALLDNENEEQYLCVDGNGYIQVTLAPSLATAFFAMIPGSTPPYEYVNIKKTMIVTGGLI